MPKFERHDNDQTNGFRQDTVIATLLGDTKKPMLSLGAQLIDKGFDVHQRYVFLWDEKTKELGLEAPREHEVGFKVNIKTNHVTGYTSYTLSAASFCNRFDIKNRFKAVLVTTATTDLGGELWILKMQKVK